MSDNDTQARPLLKAEMVTKPTRIKCWSGPASDGSRKVCGKVATHAVGKYKYCTECSQRVVKEMADSIAKHENFVAGGMEELPPPPDYPKSSEIMGLEKTYANRCRIKTEKSDVGEIGNWKKHPKTYFEPCGTYIPNDWTICSFHQERRWGFDTVYSEQDDDSGFNKDQVLWLLRKAMIS